MNYLPIVLLILLLKNLKGSSLKSVLSSIEVDSLTPILEACGLSTDVTKFVASEEFRRLIDGNFDLNTLLPLVMPLVSKFAAQNNKKGDDTKPSPVNCDFFKPIENLADDKIKSNLKELLS